MSVEYSLSVLGRMALIVSIICIPALSCGGQKGGEKTVSEVTETVTETVTAVVQPLTSSGPARNPFLSADKYAVTHFDPAQTDSFPYQVKPGTFNIDLTKFPRVPGGPVNFMQLASTSQNYMWATSTGGVSYVDVSNGGFSAVSQIASPGSILLSPETLDKVLAENFTSVAQVEKAAKDELGLDWKRLSNNVYMFVDKDNVLYTNSGGNTVNAYGLADPANPAGGIKILRSLDFSDTLKEVAKGAGASLQKYGALIVGLGVTYDGKLIVLTNRSLTVLDRSFQGESHTVQFGPEEFVSNSMAVDEKNGIYVASDKMMHKVVWTGSKLSMDEADGAWSSPYDTGQEPPSVKFGSGTGSTPTLMGFGGDQDKLVVITDGANRMNLTAFWRNGIPADFQQQPGTKSRRIAGQIPVTCGLSPLPEFIQSEQSVVVNGYGAFVVNNIRPEGHEDKLVDVLAGGPVFPPPAGAERFEWNPDTNTWSSAWARNDVVGTSMVPAVSSASGIAFINGYTKADGWEVTGMDWTTGETVLRLIFGQNNLGNGAYALIQYLPNGDLLFNSIGGPIRVHY